MTPVRSLIKLNSVSLSRTRTLLVQSAAVNNFTKRLKNSVDINWRREVNYDSQSAVQQETSNHRASHSNWVKILQSAIRRQATAVWGCVTHQILQVLPGVFVDQHRLFFCICGHRNTCSEGERRNFPALFAAAKTGIWIKSVCCWTNSAPSREGNMKSN